MPAQLFFVVLCLGIALRLESPDLYADVEPIGMTALFGLALWWAVGAVHRKQLLGRHRRAVALQVLAQTLQGSTLRNIGERTVVSGSLLGFELSVEVGRRYLCIEVLAKRASVSLDVHSASTLGLLVGQVYSGRPKLAEPSRQEKVDHALAELMGPQGFTHLSLDGRRLCATAPLEGGLASFLVLSQARALARLLEALGSSPATGVRVEAATDEGRCPYCHDVLEEAEEVRRCPACRTLHHRACFREAGGCTLLGCERVARGPRSARAVSQKGRC